jgi:hypothetical protein
MHFLLEEKSNDIEIMDDRQPGFFQDLMALGPYRQPLKSISASRLVRQFCQKKVLAHIFIFISRSFSVFGQMMQAQKVLQNCSCGSTGTNIKFYTF